MATLDRFDLYELAVTNAGPLAAMLHGAWAGTTRRPVLREDFSGSGALARAWADRFGTAIAVDRDAAPLKACAARGGVRVERLRQDVRRCRRKADVIAATNFAMGYWHARADLIAYLRLVVTCLKRGGIFCCDLYGGSDAFTTGTRTKRLRGPKGERVEYRWQQVEATPQTGLVRNAIHFRVDGGPLLRDAFTYHWRLWSIPEMTDAMREAGFAEALVFDRLGDAIDSEGRVHVRPLEDDEPMDDPFVVYVVGRVGG